MDAFFPSLYGNDHLRSRLGNAIVQGNLPHALLFEGKEGSGKKQFATLLAAALNCENKKHGQVPCAVCPACRKILNKMAVDVSYVDLEDDHVIINVGQIRKMREDMYLSSTELQNKVYIINHAECMNQEAQNALLISIEEPPPHVYVFLLAQRTDIILPTIKSRAQSIKMQNFSATELEHYLLKTSPAARGMKEEDESIFRSVLLSSDGTVGRALELLEKKAKEALLSERELTDGILYVLTTKASYARLFEKISLLPSKRQELMASISLLLKGLRDLILLKRDENAELLYHTDNEKAREEAESLSIRYLLALYDTLSAAENACAMNTNIPSLLSSLTNDLYACRSV